MRALRQAATLGRAALHLVLPPICVTCDALVDIQGQLCTACFNKLNLVVEPCCARCGTPFEYPGLASRINECMQCETTPPLWRRGRAALQYDDKARELILPLKYYDRVDLAAPLAYHMARIGAPLLREADVMVPVPLHRRRLRKRRYNQSALLAHAVGRLARIPVLADGLRRIRETESLAGKFRWQRAEIVAGAFAVPRRRVARIAGRRILLVDDVLTSGSTATACTQALLAAGAAHVDLLVAARALWDANLVLWADDRDDRLS